MASSSVNMYRFSYQPKNSGNVILESKVISEPENNNSLESYVTELTSKTIPQNIEKAHFQSKSVVIFPDFQGLDLLTYINLSRNKIRSFSCSDLPPRVQVLKLDWNEIEEIPCLKSCETLKELYLSRNSICDVEEDVFPVSTEVLSLEFNQIEYIPALPPNIRDVNLKNNPLRMLGKDCFPTVKTYDSIKNGLSEVQRSQLLQPLSDDFVRGYSHLIANCQFDEKKKYLFHVNRQTSDEDLVSLFDAKWAYDRVDLSENKLESPANWLTSVSLRYLRYLILSGNSLQELDGTLVPDSTEVLWLDRNKLKEVPVLTDKKKLVNINLAGNSLSSVEASNFPVGIESINLSCNNITTSPDVSAFGSLKELHLSHNKIKEIPDAKKVLKNSSLEELSLDNNKLLYVPDMIQNKSLKVVDLSSNLIKDIPSLLFPVSVETIMLCYNHLENIPTLSECKNLKRLILSNNQIKHCDEDCLPESLTELYLNNNMIEYLPSLEKIVKLRLLNVQCNKINTIQSLPSDINEVYMYGNPLKVLCKECFPNKAVYSLLTGALPQKFLISGVSSEIEYRLCIPPSDIFKIGFSAVIAYYSQKGTSSIHSQRYLEHSRNRFVVVGDTEAGKSSLVTSLMSKGPVLTDIVDRTQVVDILMWNITEHDVYQIFDQGGHPIYSITTPLFISKDSNILVVHDIRKPDRKSVWSTINVFRSTMQQQPNSKINFALTHTDCIDAKECKVRCASFEASVRAFVKDEMNSLTIILENMRQRDKGPVHADFGDRSVVNLLTSCRSKLSDMKFFPVSSRSFKGIEKLLQYLEDAAKLNRRVIPDKWVELFSQMNEKPKYFYQFKAIEQMFKDLHGVMKKLIRKTKISTELQECLSYFSDSGLVIWNKEHPVLSDYIFHNLVFLISVFKSLFHHDLKSVLDYDTVSNLRQCFTKDELEKAILLYQKEGLLSTKLLSYLLQHYRIDKKGMFAIISLMEQFDLCYKISGTDNDDMLYFFPWFVENSNPPTAHTTCSKNVVSLGFECVFLNKVPKNVFERLCVKLQGLAVNKHYLGERYAWKNGFCVTLNRCECWIERQEDSGVLLCWVQCPVTDLFEGWEYLTFLQKEIQSTLQQFFGVLKSFYVICTHCTIKKISPPHRRSHVEVWPKIKQKSTFVRCAFDTGEHIPAALIVAMQTNNSSSIAEAVRYVKQNWTDKSQGPGLSANQKSVLQKQKPKLRLTMHVTPVIDILFSRAELSNAQKLELQDLLKHRQVDYLVDSILVKGATALDSFRSALHATSFYINQVLSKYLCIEDFEENNKVFLTESEDQQLKLKFYQPFLDNVTVDDLVAVLFSDGTLDTHHKDDLSAKKTQRERASYLLDHVLFRGIYETVERFRRGLLTTNQVQLADCMPMRLTPEPEPVKDTVTSEDPESQSRTRPALPPKPALLHPSHH